MLVWAGDPSLEAYQWLEKMAQAKHTLNYNGTFVYLHEGQMASLRISHRVDAQGEHERLLSLDGTAREVVHDNRVITCLLPNSKVVTVNEDSAQEPFAGPVPTGVDDLGKHYSLSAMGQGRIAGRLAKRILIRPKDTYRYGYHLWLDAASGLLLKSNLLNQEGALVEQVMFTTIDVEQPKLPYKADAPACPKDLLEKQAESQKGEGKGWQVRQLPQGFRLAQHTRRLMRNQRIPVEHMVLTDGLASVSVFIERLDANDKFIGQSHMGVVNAYGTILNEHQVTVVGVVPQPTVQMIGQSIRPQDP